MPDTLHCKIPPNEIHAQHMQIKSLTSAVFHVKTAVLMQIHDCVHRIRLSIDSPDFFWSKSFNFPEA